MFVSVFAEVGTGAPHGLERPACMQDVIAPLAAGVQCPQKPRGRKKKVVDASEGAEGLELPSAAAAGFSTKGLSKKQIAARLAGAKEPKSSEVASRGRSEAKGRKPSRPRTSRGMPAGSSSDHEQVRKRKAQAEISPEEAPSSGNTRKRTKAKAASEPAVEVEKPSRKRKNTTSDGNGTSCKRSRRASKAMKSKKLRKLRKVSNNKQANKDKTLPASTPEVDPKVAAAKAKASRKSAAYHAAKRAALKAGKSEKEAAALGKAVPQTLC